MGPSVCFQKKTTLVFVMELQKKEFDAIVVGSGPGGATVARELSLKGKNILILERGDFNPVKGSFWQCAKGCLIPGRGLVVTNHAVGMIRGITTGGSSMYYCATAFEPPVEMLKKYGVDISREVIEVRDDVPVAQLSDELMSPASKPFMESALNLGYDCKKLNKFIYQHKCRPNCQLCSYGCPYDAKWNARFFVHEALENGARIINNAKVEKVIIENKKAVGVEYRHKKEKFSAYASKIIVAAGGIGSSIILRKSGFYDTGHDFFFDPLTIVLGKLKDVNSGNGIPMSSVVHFPEDGIVMTDLNVPYLFKIPFDLEVFALKKVFSHKNIVPIMVKIRDELGGRVTNSEWIWKKLTKDDKKKLDKGSAHARRILEHAGATEIYKWWYIAAHPGGTIKIGETLDENLKTKFENLYVCDCSVIPEELGLPPTWTILSLGKRLAKHLLRLDQVMDNEDKMTSGSNIETEAESLVA